MKLTQQSMENAAAFYLERFPASSNHLRRVLQRKAQRTVGYADADPRLIHELIAATVSRMIDRGLLDDGAYARALVQSLHGRGWALRKITARLRSKGLGESEVHEALLGLPMETQKLDEAAAWVMARRKRLGPFRDPETRKDRRARDLGVLARAGFSWSVAKTIVDGAVDR
ncbi:MAG: regulatory protein RecX [Deltaproteobacteria bacterium]|nr:regulatory protein RecX [Deltaproteobacteria bacterium]